MARYLITGIAGFIGSSLAHALLAQGHEVRGVDNLSNGSVGNLAGILDKVDFQKTDICDLSAMHRAMNDIDFVLHQAAVASVPRSIHDPLGTHRNNVDGTLNVLLAARDAGVSRVVYAASSSAYGDQPTPHKHEGMPPQPLSPYAVQKLTGEFYMQTFFRAYGLETVCLRYFNIFGPRQAADSPYSGVIARFARMMLAGDTPSIFGDGAQSRDFTFVQNAVEANLLACTAPAETVAGEIFNIGTGGSQSLNELYSTLAGLIGFPHPPIYDAPRMGDILHSEADISRARSALGYQPRVSFGEGLQKTLAWYRGEQDLDGAAGFGSELLAGAAR